MSRLLVAGATSAIAQETCRHFAAEGASFFLVARDEARLEAVADDLRVRGAAEVTCYTLDLTDLDAHERMLDAAVAALGGLDCLFVAYGTLPDQERCEEDVGAALEAILVNGTSVIALLTRAANRFEAQRHGTIAVISSVAGDRGRKNNYVYGAAKAAVSTFLSGLRGRLHPAGVRVLTLKPGVTDTPMTAHLKKGPLTTPVESAGRQIHQAIVAGRDVAYIPGYWRYIMGVIKAVPETLFKRLNLEA